jgi:hypothetical protein
MAVRPARLVPHELVDSRALPRRVIALGGSVDWSQNAGSEPHATKRTVQPLQLPVPRWRRARNVLRDHHRSANERLDRGVRRRGERRGSRRLSGVFRTARSGYRSVEAHRSKTTALTGQGSKDGRSSGGRRCLASFARRTSTALSSCRSMAIVLCGATKTALANQIKTSGLVNNPRRFVCCRATWAT